MVSSLLAVATGSLLVATPSGVPAASAQAEATAPSAGAAPRRGAVFAAARRDLEAGRKAEARRGFERSLTSVPELADHALFHAAGLAREAGDTAAASRDYDRLLRAHPRSIWTSSAACARGEIALEANSPRAALGHFQTALEAWEGVRRSRALLGKARALDALGRTGESWALTRELAGTPGDVGRDARVLRERLEARGPRALGTDARRLAYEIAEARRKEGRHDEALVALRPALRGRPNGPALLLEARLLRAAGRSAGADAALGRAAAAGDPEVAGEALAERARLAWNSDRDDDAAADFRRLVERFPRHTRAPEALYALGRIAEADGNGREAIAQYERLAREHPHSQNAEESAWRAAFVRFRNADPAGAAAAWQRLGARDDAIYWSGRALIEAGRTTQGRAAFDQLLARSPRSYYSWWTDAPERRVGGPVAPPPVSAVTIPEAARAHLVRARLLRELGFRDDALRELSGAENAAGPTALLLREYEALGAHRQAIRLAARLRSEGVRGLDRTLRPRAHWTEFEAAGQRYGVDPLLLASIARQESMFDERIASPADAQGVMQLLPSTAGKLAGRTMKRWELWNPTVNIDLGARYFRRMLDRFDGRAIPAIAAYNAGPGPAARWLAENGHLPGDQFVELISYRETRDYVKKVLENYRIYRELYGKPGAKRPTLL